MACSDDDPEPRSRIEFCEDWAEMACSAETVSACQSGTEEACRAAQQSFCEDLVPAGYSDAQGDACLAAVEDAYADADLTADEVDTVRRLGGACEDVVTGARSVGQTCETDIDCDAAGGVQCVQRGGQPSGTCQVPIVVNAGESCTDLAQTCTDGFFCNGSNCIATQATGAACQNDVECGSAGYCGPDGACATRLAVGVPCTVDEECQSGLCYAASGQQLCADLIRLSPAEPLCADLR